MGQPSEPILAIFDHDGVLVDTLTFHLESWLELGRRESLAITPEFVRATFGRTSRDILRLLLGDRLDPRAATRYGELKERYYREIATERLALMDGVRETLDAFTVSGARLAIGSSGPRANLDLTVRACGLEGRFAAIVSAEDVTQGKPDPEVFLTAAERVGIAPGHCVVFEDAPFGIEAAKAAGMVAVGVGTTYPLDELRERDADEAVTDLVGFDVPRFLSRHFG